MHQPPRYIHPQHPKHVCCLHKAIYGLKQAPRAWFHKLRNTLLTWEFQCSRAGNSLFFCHTTIDMLIKLIYVDDILVTGSSVDQLRSFISHFSSVFALQYIGHISYFLRIEVQQCSTYLHISQQKYIHNLLTRTTMIEGKATLTPSALGKPLSFSDGEPLPDPSLY